MTYKSGVALDCDTIPDYIKEAEVDGGDIESIVPFYGCFVKGHITSGAKKCRYRGLKNLGQLNAAVNDYLAKSISRTLQRVLLILISYPTQWF